MNRKHFHLAATLEHLSSPAATNTFAELKDDAKDQFLVSMLVGDGTYNGLFCPTEEIARGASSMDRNPVNLDHSLAVADEVGFVQSPQMFDRALKGVVVLNPKTAKYAVALAYIENRFAAGKPPEVSVGFWCDVDEEEGGQLTARNITFDHLALVSRGACSPADGCGIGMARKENPTMEPNDPAAGAKPADEAEGAPAAPPAPEAKAAAPPCGCAGLKAQVEGLESEKKALAERLVVYESREMAALTSEAMRLGVPVEDSDGIPCLTKKIALAKSVLASRKPDEPETPKRHTLADQAPASVATVESQAKALLAKAGFEF